MESAVQTVIARKMTISFQLVPTVLVVFLLQFVILPVFVTERTSNALHLFRPKMEHLAKMVDIVMMVFAATTLLAHTAVMCLTKLLPGRMDAIFALAF
jgi:hypothetical protein